MFRTHFCKYRLPLAPVPILVGTLGAHNLAGISFVDEWLHFKMTSTVMECTDIITCHNVCSLLIKQTPCRSQRHPSCELPMVEPSSGPMGGKEGVWGPLGFYPFEGFRAVCSPMPWQGIGEPKGAFYPFQSVGPLFPQRPGRALGEQRAPWVPSLLKRHDPLFP